MKEGIDSMDVITFLKGVLTPVEPTGSYVIEFNGEIVKLTSGKYKWNKINHAKSAFTNLCCYRARTLGFKDGPEMREYCEANGLVKFKKYE